MGFMKNKTLEGDDAQALKIHIAALARCHITGLLSIRPDSNKTKHRNDSSNPKKLAASTLEDQYNYKHPRAATTHALNGY